MRSTTKDLERLERELEGSAYQALLRELQRKHLFISSFRAWADVLAFMRQGTSRDPSKDEILRPILAAHCADGDYRWRTILLVIFWPGLSSIHWKKRHWDLDDQGERWQRIYWAFHQSVCRINLDRRRDRLAQWIYNSTIHRLYDQYQRDWIHAEREVATEPEVIAQLASVTEPAYLDAIALQEEFQERIDRYGSYRDAGLITQSDFLLLVGTRLYGRTIAEYALSAGLKAETAKKRRQRAEEAIRRHEKEVW